MYFLLDANVYRDFANEIGFNDINAKANYLKSLEDKHGYKSICSVVVVIELISHLVDGDSKKEECFKALCLLSKHTLRNNAKGQLMRNVAYHMNDVLTNFFEKKDSIDLTYYKDLLLLMENLTENNDINNCITHIDNIKIVRKNQLEFRDNIRSNMESFLKDFTGPTVDWAFFVNRANKKANGERLKKIRDGSYFYEAAYSLVQRAAKDMGFTNYKPSKKKLSEFLSTFQAPLVLNLRLISQVGEIENMHDPEDKRWNTLNDTQLLFNLCDKIYPNLILVSEDKLLHGVCDFVGIPDRIKKRKDYLQIIQ